MKRFAQNGSEVWAGVLPKLGVVVYDPQSQVNVPANRVRLYVRDQMRMATFDKDIVRARLTESANEEVDGQLTETVDFYLALPRRYAPCFSCKRSLNSVDYEVCGRCRWIKCVCDACGCNFHG